MMMYDGLNFGFKFFRRCRYVRKQRPAFVETGQRIQAGATLCVTGDARALLN